MTETHIHPAELKTILIVDDTPDNLTILGELLMPHYNVKIANNGMRALISAECEPAPDLILLDIMMPEMDGHEVLRRLKSNPKTQSIPVIFISALNEEHDETHGLESGAVDYITKPFKPAIALARVKAQLEPKTARDLLQNSNTWLENEVARRMRQNQMIQDVSIRALAKLAEARDNETGNHILRTQAYVQILAEELAGHPRYGKVLTAETVTLYTKAAPLHDIGKVGIPDQVLHKPGKHTSEEWEIMKTHAQIGANAIWEAIQDQSDQDGLSFLHIAMEIAAHHHEKWDGSGYPNGLAGEDIPFAAG
nr:response regulator [Methylomonas sp. LL1]